MWNRKWNKPMSCLVLIVISPILLCSCISERMYMLRMAEIKAIENHQQQLQVMQLKGPGTIEVKDGGEFVVNTPNRPYKQLDMPDHVATIVGFLKSALNVGLIAFLGGKAINKADNSRTYNTYNAPAGGN